MGEAPGTHRRAEAVGELRYLSIRLQEYVVALPARSLPPRGRVPWSPDELAMLRALAYQLSAGERDADRAVSALDAIASLFAREPGANSANDSLTDYLAQRAIVIDTLPRLQRVADGQSAPPPPSAAPESRPSAPWQSLWARLTRPRS
jgi:hypothetical protein